MPQPLLARRSIRSSSSRLPGGAGVALLVGAGLVLGWAGCGGEAPAPRTAGAAHDDEPAAASNEPPSRMGDSALEPSAKAAMKEEDWARAETLYRELARRERRNPAGNQGLGEALLKQDKADQAVEALKASLDVHDDVRTRLDLAAAFGKLGRYPSALPHLRQAVKQAPGDPRGWAMLADALVKVDRPADAADVLLGSEAACKTCDRDEAWGQAADEAAAALATDAGKRLAANDATGARQAADAAAKLRPELPAVHLAAGRVARAGGDTKQAAAELRKAVEGIPDAKSDDGAAARLELANLLIADGGGDEASKLARAVVDAGDEKPGALDTLGRACDATEDVACARGAYQKLSKLQPSDELPQATIDHARQRLKALKGKRGKKNTKKGKRTRKGGRA